jgi:hypothetical protein
MNASTAQAQFDLLTTSVSDHAKAVYMAAFRNLLLPLIRMAMRHGLAYGELSECLERALAECAESPDLGGYKGASVARLSIVTGIPRRDMNRLKDSMGPGAAEELSNLNRIARLIVGWYQDFIGPYGIPLELPMEPGEKSFPDLVRRYGGQVSPKEILGELKSVGVADETDDGKVRLTNRSYITGRLRPEIIERMSWAIHDLADTLDFNLDPMREAPARFERRVFTPEPIGGNLLSAFQQLVVDDGQAFLERLDNWLNEQFQEIRKNRRQGGTSSAEVPPADSKYVGVGLYWFERNKIGA